MKVTLKEILNSDYEPYIRTAFNKAREVGLELDHNFKRFMLLDDDGKFAHRPMV